MSCIPLKKEFMAFMFLAGSATIYIASCVNCLLYCLTLSVFYTENLFYSEFLTKHERTGMK